MNHINPTAGAILDFWFGELDETGQAAEEQQKRWFERNLDSDHTLVSMFGDAHARAMAASLTLGPILPSKDWRS